MKAEKWFKHPIGILLSSCLATLLWGSAVPLIKLSYERLEIGKNDIYSQFLFAGYRFALAGLLLFAVALWMTPSSGKIGFWRLSRLALIQTFLQYVFFYIGVMNSSGIQGAIISGSASFFQMLMAHWMYRNEPFNRSKMFGLALGFLGVFAVGFQKSGMHFQFGPGEICLLLSTIFGAFGNILARHESRTTSVLDVTAKQMLLGGLGLVAVGASQTGLLPFHMDMQSILMLIYLAVLSACAFALWNSVMKYNQVGKVSMYLFLIPVFGVILSALLLGEVISVWVIAALACVVSGIVIVNRAHNIRASSQSANLKSMENI